MIRAPFGLDLQDGAAAAVGIYATKNVGALLGNWLPSVTDAIDNVRPGLGVAALEAVGAVVVSKVAGWVAPAHKRMVAVGSGAIVVSDTVAAIFGQVNLIGGQPAFSDFSILGGGSKLTPGGGTPMGPNGMQNANGAQLGGAGTIPALPSGNGYLSVPTATQVTGVGSAGF